MEAAANTRIPDFNGDTSLQSFLVRGQLEVFKWLHQVGANDNTHATNKEFGTTPMLPACEWG